MKYSRYDLISCIIVCLFFSISCNDVIEQDISQSTINVITPKDSFKTNNYDVLFWWEEVSDVQQYRLQIVAPSFDNIQSLILDTNIINKESKINITLFSGTYQWRIRGENGNSFTQYITRNITIDTSSDLSKQLFVVNSPADNYNTNTAIINYSWQQFPYVDEYQYALYDKEGSLIKTKRTSEYNIVDTLIEGEYKWAVRGINYSNNTFTKYSTARNINIDFKAPAIPSLMVPAENGSVKNPVSLQWVSAIDAIEDSLLIATDSNFQNILHGIVIKDKSSYTLPSMDVNNSYYWKLRSKDLAGNWSEFSNVFKFSVTP